MRSDDFFDVAKHPEANFESTSFTQNPDGTGTLKGNLTLKGVTNPVTIDVTQIGHGKDSWGGYRRGFLGTTELTLADYGIDFNLGPASKTVMLELSIEGIRQ